jgi:hypothetical protein
MSIVVLRRGHKALRLETKPIPNEFELQEYIQANPECLPMNEIQENLRLVVVAREFPTQSGPIDIVALDSEGNVYLIETKLFRNPDKRQVIAQILDYGASLWKSSEQTDTFINDLHKSAILPKEQTLVEKLQDSFSIGFDEIDDLLQSASLNVKNGAFRFIVLMDRIGDRMKDLISFVNENSRFTVYGVELEFFQFEDLEILIPKLYGAETRKEVASGSLRRTWNEKSFFADAGAKLSASNVQAIRELYDFVEKAADRVTWGTGVTMGSFNPRFEHIIQPSVITVYSDGRICISFGALLKTEIGQEVASKLAEGIRDDLKLNLPKDFESSYPHFRADEWCNKVDSLISLLKSSLIKE